MGKIASYLSAAIVMGIVPGGVFAHSYGPPARVTAAPGDNPRACTQCHSRGVLNSGSGSVTITLQGGPVYIPNVKQRVTVRVAEAGQQRWGFQLTARLNSDPQNGQAGDFAPVDHMTQVVCEDNSPKPCRSGVSFIHHTSAGTRSGTPDGAAFQFDWIPPATNVGRITLYAAGNCANGDNNSTGDSIYSTSVELTPTIPAAPTVTAGNIVSAATGVAGPVTANSWVTVYGANLGVTSRSWDEGDFVNGGIPFSLDGVSVVLNAVTSPRLAYVGYVSPGQVNFLLPSDVVPGNTMVQIKNPAGTSTPVPITVQGNAPQLFTLDGKNALGVHANGVYLGKNGLLEGTDTAPARPGETISVYGTGLGPTAPALIPGQVPTEPAALVRLPQVTLGGADATVVSATVVPGSPGVYLITFRVPAGLPSDDAALTVQVANATSASTLVTVQN